MTDPELLELWEEEDPLPELPLELVFSDFSEESGVLFSLVLMKAANCSKQKAETSFLLNLP